MREAKRTLTWGLAVPAVAAALAVPSLGLSLGLLAAYPVQALRIARGTRQRGFTLRESALWGLSCAVSKLPESLGVIKYRLDKMRQKRADHYRVQGAQPMKGTVENNREIEARGHPGGGLHRRLPPVRPAADAGGGGGGGLRSVAHPGGTAGLAVDGAQAYTDLARMIAEARPDVVHVLTPPTAHFAPTKQLLEAGVAVFAEKPLAVRSEDCAALGKLAAERGLALGTGHNFLFAPAYERLMQDVTSGRLGRLDQVDIVWNKPLPPGAVRAVRGLAVQGQPQRPVRGGAALVRPPGPPAGRRSCRCRPRRAIRCALPNDLVFHRQWEIRGSRAGRGAAAVLVHRRVPRALRPRARLGRQRHRSTSSSDLHVAGALEDLLDFDRFAASVRGAKDALVQAGTHAGVVRAVQGGPAVRRRAVPDQHQQGGAHLLRRAGRGRARWIGDWAPTWPGRR